MLARLQRFITLALLAVACGWWFYFRVHAPQFAIAGFFAIVLGYTGFLALEFMLLRVVNRGDPSPRATAAELFSAWLGETLVAPRVFCWRQPFRPNEVPDALSPVNVVHGRRGVVFIHGFFCNRAFWTPWLKRLRSSGHAFVAVSLEPVFASIDDYVPQIEAAVTQVTEATGMPPLLVCHSMGGAGGQGVAQGHAIRSPRAPGGDHRNATQRHLARPLWPWHQWPADASAVRLAGTA